MGVYRLEISKGSRAGCRTKQCLDNAVKIQKGELRFGTQIEIQEHQSWQWRHWGCVTPKQIANLNETIGGDFDYLDGYEDLTPEMQEMVKVALEQGHVDDTDWKGDVEFNRPGMTGMRQRTPKKKGPEDMAENNEAQLTPTKPGPKKRTRTKKAAGDEEEEVAEAPSPKKAKTAARRSKKVEADEETANGEDKKPTTRQRAKRGKQVEDVGGQAPVDEEVAAPNIKIKRSTRKLVSNNLKEESEEEPATPKHGKANGRSAVAKKRGPNTKVKSEELDMDSEESMEDPPQAKKGRKKAPAKRTTKSRAKKASAEAVDDNNTVEAG